MNEMADGESLKAATAVGGAGLPGADPRPEPPPRLPAEARRPKPDPVTARHRPLPTARARQTDADRWRTINERDGAGREATGGSSAGRRQPGAAKQSPEPALFPPPLPAPSSLRPPPLRARIREAVPPHRRAAPRRTHRARAARWPQPPPGQREPRTGPPRGGAARAGRLRGARTALPARQRGDPGTRKSDSRTKWAGTENVRAAVKKPPAALCVSALPAVVAAWGPRSSPGDRPELPPRSRGGCGGTMGSKPLQSHRAV